MLKTATCGWPARGSNHRIAKTLLVMKLTFVLLTVGFLNVCAEGVSQNVTFSGDKVPLKTVFRSVEKQTGFLFLSPESVFLAANPVSISVVNMPLDNFLALIFRSQPLKYIIDGKSILVSPIVGVSGRPLVPSPVSGVAQPAALPVYGVIYDENKTPLAGATVLVKGTNKFANTDTKGEFYFPDVDPDAILVISFVGYMVREEKVAATSNHIIIMQLATTRMEEVTVSTGYWQTSKARSTGNISKVNAATISQQPVLNPLQALQGRMTGVQIIQNTGVPGGGFNVQIRGRNSLRDDGNNPLYLVDGVPFPSASVSRLGLGITGGGNPLSSLDPRDIESVEVLKDADATAIYGSRGGNGVILITTKKAGSGKTRVDLDVSAGFSKVGHYMKMMNTTEYLTMLKEALRNDGQEPIDPSLIPYLPQIYVWDPNKHTNWQKEIIGGTAKNTKANLSISGGNASTRFTLGGNYYKENTVFPGDNAFKRGGGQFNLAHSSPDKKFNVNFSTQFSVSNSDLLLSDLTSAAVTLAPNTPALFDATGNPEWKWDNDAYQNPMVILNKRYSNATSQLNTRVSISYELLRDLQLKTAFGYNAIHVDEYSTNPLSAVNPLYRSFIKASASFGNSSTRNWIVEPQLSYERNIGQGKFSALAGLTFQENILSGQTIDGTGYVNDDLLENIKAAAFLQLSSANYSKYRYSAVYGRVNYTLKDRYILNLTGRRDGSSRFGPDKQFADFYAIGGAWLFSQEKWLRESLPLLSFGKLRASYGLTGSDQIGDYQFLNTYSPTDYPYLGTGGLTVTRLYNPDFSWETTRKMEVGLELGFWNNRLSVSGSWYRNRTSDQLVGLPLPVMTGQSSIQFNLPAIVQNAGFELELRSTNIQKGDFKWTTDANITFPRNKLVAFPNLNAFPDYQRRYEVGKSLYVQRVLQYTGVDPTTGVYTFKDVNHDGFISTVDDALFLREISQRFYGGLANNFSYKSFSLDLLFQFVKQTGYSFERNATVPGGYANQPVEVLDRWQRPGDQATKQQYSIIGQPTSDYTNYIFSDQVIADASFVRLKNVALSWNLPVKALTRSISQARLYLNAQNLFTITNYIGLDPENRSMQILPPLRTIAIGFQLTF